MTGEPDILLGQELATRYIWPKQGQASGKRQGARSVSALPLRCKHAGGNGADREGYDFIRKASTVTATGVVLHDINALPRAAIAARTPSDPKVRDAAATWALLRHERRYAARSSKRHN